MILVNFFFLMVFMLIGVAFYTLVERRVLGCFQLRLGPSRVGPLGLLQPFSDAIKLFLKSVGFVRRVDFFFWNFAPILAIFLFLVTIVVIPYGMGPMAMDSGVLYFFCVMASGVYFLMWGGFFSGSKYSLLGSYRAVSQMISYEVVIMFIFLGICIFVSGVNFIDILSSNGILFLVAPTLFGIWLIACLAESNRLPFDFLEGESELVSGFNTEYWGGYFSLIFIFEYGFMVVFSIFTSIVFFNSFMWYMVVVGFMYFYLWVRATFPRSRYDYLMYFAWKKLLLILMGVLGYIIVIL